MTGSCCTALDHAAMFDRLVDHLSQDQLAGLRCRQVGLGQLQRLLQLHQLDLDGGQDDVVLGRELVVDGRLGHAEGVGDHLQRRAVDPVLPEQLEGGMMMRVCALLRRIDRKSSGGLGLGRAHPPRLADRLCVP